MNIPQIQLIPLRDAVRFDTVELLDVLVRVVPPRYDLTQQRPALNLCLVIDRSSSMSWDYRIGYAKAAAIAIVKQLRSCDRISIVVFDRHAKVVQRSIPVRDAAAIETTIEQIQLGYGTNVYAGWSKGIQQIRRHQQPNSINRVILLSDGLVTAGETREEVIFEQVVQQQIQHRISTTTIGVGSRFNERLLKLIANYGGGNYHYIESAHRLPSVLGLELQGLSRSYLQRVHLKIEPYGDVQQVDVLNDLGQTLSGAIKLPDLVSGLNFNVVVRLHIPAHTETDFLCRFRLAWDVATEIPADVDIVRREIQAKLQLPTVPTARIAEFPPSPDVQEHVALMESARAKKLAIHDANCGQYDQAQQRLRLARINLLQINHSYSSNLLKLEMRSLLELENMLQKHQVQQFRKRADYEAYHATRSPYQDTLEQHYDDTLS